MVDLRVLVFQKHPMPFFAGGTAVLSFMSLSPTPSFVPVVLLLAMLQVYSRILLPRPKAFSRALLLWVSLSLGVSAAQLMPSLHALSTPAMSIIVLFALSATSSFVALSAIFLDTRLCTRMSAPWSQITIFPAIWATLWCAVSHLSPVGRLAIWSPVTGMERYNWILQWVGPVGIDWIVGAWAVVCSQSVGAWFIGSESLNDTRDDEPLIDDIPHRESTKSTSHAALLLGVLALLSVPSFVLNNLPLPPVSSKTTPLSVGCVLPSFRRYKHHSPTLDDYIKESKRMTSAKIVLWPEGAVTFLNAGDREAALEKVRNQVNGPYVGVSFEEFFSDPNDLSGRSSLRRTGMALVSNKSNSTYLTYYKRHLVPIAESFSLTHSTTPPSIYHWDLSRPSDIPASEWGTDSTRSIPLTASICLDFSAPSTFVELESRPALILAPARTWHPAIGLAMWQQAKQRAEEIGSMVLWCDGGEGGVSGIAGKGLSEVTQVGEGSWIRDIGIQWPLDEGRTVYARYGDSAVLLLLWALVSLGFVGNKAVGDHLRVNLDTQWIRSRVGDVRRRIGGLRQGSREQRQEIEQGTHLLD